MTDRPLDAAELDRIAENARHLAAVREVLADRPDAARWAAYGWAALGTTLDRDAVRLVARVRELEAELCERLRDACDGRRLAAWMDNPDREPANLAFTAGPGRQVAYRFEDVLRRAGPGPVGPDDRPDGEGWDDPDWGD